jgi:4-hydroxy-3-methylbut-2-enyl diphosphate reductase
VRALSPQVDLILVVGAQNSSNSNRLRDLGASMDRPSYLIADAGDLVPAWLEGVTTIGITAGASAPEELVQGVIERLSDFGDVEVEPLTGVEENVIFKLPRELADPVAGAAQ